MAAHLDTAEFSDGERSIVAAALRERYRSPVGIEPIDAELRLDADTASLTSCPGLYWTARGAHFVLVRVGQARYRAQFFYRPDQHYWTGRAEYSSLADCVTDILRAQSDDERERQGADSGAGGGELADDGQ